MGKRSRVRTLRFILLFIFLTTALFSGVNKLQNITLYNGELILTFSQPLEKQKIKHFTLFNPFRQVFDFPNSKLLRKKMGRGLHPQIRIGQFRSKTVRVVIENSRRYSCASYAPILSTNVYHIPLPRHANTVPKATVLKARTITQAQGRGMQIKKKKVKQQSKKNRRKNHDLIVIDAGHGGHDSGAVGGGKKEKDLVLSIARRVAKELLKKGYRVHLTRSNNRFLKLSERTHIADRKGSVAFISIHANAVPRKHRHKVQGVETYFLQKTRDAKSQRIAARENRSVLKGAGSRLSKKVIVDSVLNGPKIVQSNKLAIDVQRRIITNLRSQYRGVKDGGVRHAPFYVLVGASRPSILVEVGYISHPKERKRLFTSRYQGLIAKGISEGLDNYLNNRKNEIDLQ